MEYKLGLDNYIVVNYTQPVTSGTLAVSGACVFRGIIVNPDGTNDVTINLWDNTVVSGTTRILPQNVVFTGNGGLQVFGIAEGLPAYNGIYVEVTCAGTYQYQVTYDKEML